ncbi:capping complex subunit for YIEGIA [Aneurinibacillus terranovensis]|uniref:capping complex subunit for YIEGIA n=1 Tax=Aneurinibacillus terranovensis TaxID=278991 RepID=UPI0003FA1972|nr:hypothetical protein [Aneurinibacillus terranovensis]
MSESLQSYILAVITMASGNVGGGAPIFHAASEEEMQGIAFTLEKILDGTAHEVTTDTLIIVKH